MGGVVSGALAVWVEEAVDPAGVAQQQLVVRPARVLLVLTCTHRQLVAGSSNQTKEKQYEKNKYRYLCSGTVRTYRSTSIRYRTGAKTVQGKQRNSFLPGRGQVTQQIFTRVYFPVLQMAPDLAGEGPDIALQHLIGRHAAAVVQ